MQITSRRSIHSTQLPQSTHRPARPAFKAPEWATAAIAEGRDPVDAGANTLAKKIITGITSLAVAAALTLTPVDGQAQNISAEAFKKCEVELMADYAAKISKAQADGKLHLAPVYERRRGEAIESLCALKADIAATDQRIAAGRSEIAAGRSEIAAADQRIAAGRSEIAAGRSEIAANKELETLFGRVKKIADKITAGSTGSADFKELKEVYAELQKRQSDPGASRLLALVAPLIPKLERLQ